jgi:peptidoglycan/LPS O-acetylase OafA/YrhL
VLRSRLLAVQPALSDTPSHTAAPVPCSLWISNVGITLFLQVCCLVRLDLSQSAWQLSSSNHSINVQTRLPAHVLGVLAAAGVVQQDPLYRWVPKFLGHIGVLAAAAAAAAAGVVQQDPFNDCTGGCQDFLGT